MSYRIAKNTAGRWVLEPSTRTEDGVNVFYEKVLASREARNRNNREAEKQRDQERAARRPLVPE